MVKADHELRHVLDDLHLRQMRSPAHPLGNSVWHIMHILGLLPGFSSEASSGRFTTTLSLYVDASGITAQSNLSVENPLPT